MKTQRTAGPEAPRRAEAPAGRARPPASPATPATPAATTDAGVRLARARTLGHRPPVQICADRAGGAAPVRRSFGFEIELQLGLGWADEDDAALDDSRYSAPDTHLNKYPVAATGDGFEVHIDHSDKVHDVVPGSNAIVELVTKPPIDESATSKEDVEGRMQQMLDFVGSADEVTSSLAGRGKLTAVTGVQASGARDGYFFVGGEQKDGQQLDSGYVQNTVVVKASKVPSFFGQVKEPAHTLHPISRPAAQATETATLSPNGLIKHASLIPRGWKKTGDDEFTSGWGETRPKSEIVAATVQAATPLMGLLALLVNQLIVGRFITKHPTNALLKNHLGLLFYKSRLSNLRGGLGAAAVWYLDDDTVRAKIFEWVLAQGRRPGGEDELVVKVIPGSPKVGDWVDSVLRGIGDPLYDAAANPYSSEIVPYEVGPMGNKEVGVAIESRKTAPSEGFTYPGGVPTVDHPEPIEDQSQRPTDDWKKIAVKIWRQLRALNDVV